MQYVPGRSLQARVDEDGPLGVEEILRIGMQAACGLAAAHRQGLVHRDVKPSNILLEDTVERALLTDFGLARTFDDASLTHTGILAGTPHYMSPEQATGEPIDQRSDLFGLGAVLYFMATGHPPFRAASAMAVLHRICHDRQRPVWQRNREIPDALSDTIDRLLEKKPSRRFSSADEVQQHLAGLLSRLQQYGLGRRRFRFGRHTKLGMRALVASAALVLLIAVGIGIGLSGDRTQPVKPPGDPPHVATRDFTLSEVAELTAIERQFQQEFDGAVNAFSRAPHESFYMQNGDDPWQREMRALEKVVSEYESQTQIKIDKGTNQ
jgi:serine/threonine-protein kinase